MNLRIVGAVAIVLVAGLLGSTPSASAQVKLKKALPQNKKVVMSVDTVTEQTLTLAGQKIPSKSEQNAVQSATYSAAGEGKTAVAHKVDEIQLRVNANGMEFAYDSKNPEKGADSEIGKQIAKSLEATLKGQWTSTHDAQGKVLEITGLDKLIEGLDPQAAALVKASLNEEVLKERLTAEANRIPADPVKVGDTWEQVQKMQIGGGQIMTFDRKYKYAGVVERDGKKLHRIEVTATGVKFSIAADSPLPLKLKSSELKVTESKGELLFDNDAGRVIDESDKVRVEGKLAFEIAGQELPGDLDLTITTAAKERS